MSDPIYQPCEACGAVEGEPCRPMCLGQAQQEETARDLSEDAFEPNPSPAVVPVLPPYVASALERSRWHREQAVLLRRQAVRQLKTEDWTWTAIGEALGVSRQRAEQIGRGDQPYTPRPAKPYVPIEF